MSHFSKSSYVYLASILRDEKNKAKDHKIANLYVDILIGNFADALETENPNAFNKPQFLHNVFCGQNHPEGEKCDFGFTSHVASNQ